MKVHITNSYNYSEQNIIIQNQKKIAKIGNSLSFFEMGIAKCDITHEGETVISAMLDGIIAAVEYGDLVIIQLPTGNGIDYERKLADKIWAYSNRKAIMLWHDEEYYSKYKDKLASYINTEKCIADQDSLSEYDIKQILLDMVIEAERKECPYMCADDFANDSKMIHMAFGIHDKDGTYSVWVGTAIQSVIEHTDSMIMFHIMHDNTLSDENKKKLIYTAKAGGHRIVFYNLEDSIFNEIKSEISEDFTIGAMFRLLLPDILPSLSKIIYLDADVFVKRDIAELWNLDISGYCMAVVQDMWVLNGSVEPYPVRNKTVNKEHYFNTGMLVMNLDNIRENGRLSEKVVNYLKSNKEAVYPDQDALNVIFNGKCLYVDNCWNYFVVFERGKCHHEIEDRIYHYVGTKLILYLKEKVDELYYETMTRTQWKSESCLKIIESSLGRLDDRITQLNALSKSISDRKLVFYGSDSYAMNNIKSLLCANIENSIFIEKFENYLSVRKQDYVVIVTPEAEEGNGIKILERNGFISGIDYFVVPRLLHMYKGGYI